MIAVGSATLCRRDLEENCNVARVLRGLFEVFEQRVGTKPHVLRLGAVVHAHLCRSMQASMNEEGAGVEAVERVFTFDGVRVEQDETLDREDTVQLVAYAHAVVVVEGD